MGRNVEGQCEKTVDNEGEEVWGRCEGESRRGREIILLNPWTNCGVAWCGQS